MTTYIVIVDYKKGKFTSKVTSSDPMSDKEAAIKAIKEQDYFKDNMSNKKYNKLIELLDDQEEFYLVPLNEIPEVTNTYLWIGKIKTKNQMHIQVVKVS